METSATLTQLLRRVRQGDRDAADRLLPAAYAELRRIAESYLRRERRHHTLQPTALVHEAYLRMVDQEQPEYRDRGHFFGIVAQLMRQILVDHARARNAGRRGGGKPHIELIDVAGASETSPELFLDLDDALRRLERHDPRKARLIELRFFAGLTGEECAEALGVSAETVWRDLRMGQAWLRTEMARSSAD
jgi:RNA polymerase sigma factor (TIGR02999 family)